MADNQVWDGWHKSRVKTTDGPTVIKCEARGNKFLAETPDGPTVDKCETRERTNPGWKQPPN